MTARNNLLTYTLFLCGTAECTAADAFKHAGENIVFASGSPFENVDLGNPATLFRRIFVRGFSVLKLTHGVLPFLFHKAIWPMF